jgi:hypothetical protein
LSTNNYHPHDKMLVYTFDIHKYDSILQQHSMKETETKQFAPPFTAKGRDTFIGHTHLLINHQKPEPPFLHSAWSAESRSSASSTSAQWLTEERLALD